MIQTQQFEAFPVFGDSSSKAQPEAAIYSNGFAPQDVLPAEYFNWFINKASNGITDLNKGVSSIETELNNVVVAGGSEPTEETSNQVITTIKYLIAQAKAEAKLESHPVGSLYWSSKDTDPGTLFGGTWTRIKDKFILAAGDTYTNGNSGGASTVTLTLNEIPSHAHGLNSHTHSFTPSGSVSSHTHGLNSHTHSFTPSGSVSSHTHGLNSHTHSFTPKGSVSSHSHTISSGNGFFGGSDLSQAGGVIEYMNDSAGGFIGGSITFRKLRINGNTGSATPTFTGTAGTTGASSGNTGSTTPTFTGTAGTTGASSGNTTSVGSGASHNNMPPYIVKYCWERTA